MNTMKKEDMIKEQGDLVTRVGVITVNILQPVSQILGMIGRITYLQSEIDKVTPKPAPQEVQNDQVATEKSSG